MSQSINRQDKCDAAVTIIDSLAFNYDIKKMTVILNGKLVPYSVIFQEHKPVDNKYKFMHGAMDPIGAIKRYGEKYRNGLLVYKEKSEKSNE